MPPRTLTAIVIVGVVGAALAAGEIAARAAIHSRLASPTASTPPQFVGSSALLALATRRVPVAVTLDAPAVEDLLAPRLAEAAGVDLDGVTLTDGALGLEVALGAAGRPATVWVGLSAADASLTATVLSVEAAGLQVPAALVLGDRTTMTLDRPLGDRCPGVGVDAAAVTADGVRLAFTVSPDSHDCTPLEDS
ncbi:hypothetical protein [Demequina silvatica]|uniref:hypothetical protein n=1 Tax=Demequina silvatica TaxID=1638988 RepID=UPI000782B8EF|nr:hypothetical protein [Demequina silvatica]